MKYLVTVTRGPLPPDQAVALLQAGKEWINAAVKAKRLDSFYGFPEGGGVGVVNADSNDELMKQLRENPLFPFTQTAIRPLVDINLSLDSAIQMFQRRAR